MIGITHARGKTVGCREHDGVVNSLWLRCLVVESLTCLVADLRGEQEKLSSDEQLICFLVV